MKREMIGLILFSILILFFSIYSYDANSANEGCGSCESDAECNLDNYMRVLPQNQWSWACRPRGDCVVGGIGNLGNVEYECTSGVSIGEFGAMSTSYCYAIRNVNSCIFIGENYRDGDFPVCDNEYSCNEDQLNINYKRLDYPNRECDNIGTYSINCADINERCNNMDGAYGESCTCRANGQTGSCVEPTNFVRVRTSTSNRANPEKLYDGYDANMGLRCFDYEGTDCVEDLTHLNFFENRGAPYNNVAGVLYYKDFLGDSWTHDENNGYTILDLGINYEIYAIRLYGHANIQFRLYYSLNNNDWYSIYNGNMGSEPNLYRISGYIPEDDNIHSDSYFLIKYNRAPQEGEIYLNSPRTARYIKYEVTRGVNTNLAAEIVIEGKPAEEEGPVCGNGRIDGRLEECDGNDLNEKTCNDYDYNRGILRCYEPDVVRNRCRFDTSGCYYRTGNIDFDLRVNAGRALRRVDEGEVLMCPGDSNEVRISLMNVDDERGNSGDVIIYDNVYYDPDCDNTGILYYQRTFNDCENLGYGESCIKRYNLNYAWFGCYYHNVYVRGRQ